MSTKRQRLGDRLVERERLPGGPGGVEGDVAERGAGDILRTLHQRIVEAGNAKIGQSER